MSSLFKFQDEEELCECDCPHCSIVENHLELALKSNDEEELGVVLASLYNRGRNMGYREAMIDDIAVKAETLESIDDDE